MFQKLITRLGAIVASLLFLAGPSVAAEFKVQGARQEGIMIYSIAIPRTALVNDVSEAIPACQNMAVWWERGNSGAATLYPADSDDDLVAEIEANTAIKAFTTNEKYGPFTPEKAFVRFVVDTVNATVPSVAKVLCSNFASNSGVIEGLSSPTSTGPNYSTNSLYANLLNSSNYQSSMLIAAGNDLRPNYIRAPDLRPVDAHDDLGVIAYTTTGASDDTGAEICADGAINTFGFGACVEVDDDQNDVYESTCAAALGTGNAVNVRCGAGAIGTEPSFASIFGGYDNHLSHQAGFVLSQHSSIGPGDGGGHASIFGGSTHFVEGDCEFGSIFGGAENFIWCDRTSSNISKANSIFGSLTSRIRSDNLSSYNFDSSFNGIFASQDAAIDGASFGGSVIAGIRSGIMIAPTIGSATVSDEARNNFVTGTGSAVESFDPGNGTPIAPSYAKASGLGGRTWMDNQECHGLALGSDPNESAMTGLDGSGGATAQVCKIRLVNFNIVAGNPGTYTSLFVDRAGAVPITFTEDGVWSVEGNVVCAERNTTNPNRHFMFHEVKGVVATAGIGSGTGTASFYDNTLAAVSTVAGTVVGGREFDAAWSVASRLASRNETASVDGGFDVQVQVNNGGGSVGAMECAADLDVVMIRDL